MNPSSTTPKNGVAIETRGVTDAPHRTYEVYQRERVGESTEKLSPGQLIAPHQLHDPHDALRTLREHYPCYRDWRGNAYWITRYNDVTSIFADRANFDVPCRAAACGFTAALDRHEEIPAHEVWAGLIDEHLPQACAKILDRLGTNRAPDLTLDYALPVTQELQRAALGWPEERSAELADLLWRIERCDSVDAQVADDGRAAWRALASELDDTTIRSGPLHAALDNAPADDLLATLLGFDARTVFGWLANLTGAWLADAGLQVSLRQDRSALKIAALETMRHSPPVTYAHCFARHEVERFGRLLPAGALLRLSAQAANRDPRVFADPDRFLPDRRDICHREARGQFRADGLATGIAFGLGLPSKHPAMPEDRPRSLYALTRDAVIAASLALFEACPTIRASSVASPRALGTFEPMLCWELPVELSN